MALLLAEMMGERHKGSANLWTTCCHHRPMEYGRKN
jgi:hypothetical protein